MGFIAKRFDPNPSVLKNNLQHWFNFDNLPLVKGIALLVGVDAQSENVSALIRFGDDAAKDRDNLGFGISLLNGDEITIIYKDSDDPDVPDVEWCSDEEAYEYFEKARDRFRPFVASYRRLTEYWISGKHPEITPLSYYVEWAISKGCSPAWLSVAEELELVIPAKNQSTDNELLMPNVIDRAHVSDRLAILNQAAQKFWANACRDDQSTHPINSNVATWLVDRGYSQKLADSAATIIRPEWVPKGRKREE